MDRAIDPGALSPRPSYRRYAIAAAVVAVLLAVGWSLWAGAAGQHPAAEGTEQPWSPWAFGIAALVLVAACSAAAGHFHARARMAAALQPAPAQRREAAAADSVQTVQEPQLEAAGLFLALRSIPGPAWLLARDTDHGPLQLLHANDAADALLNSAGAARPDDWPTLLDSLPGPLQQGARQLAPGQGLQQAGWSLRLEQYRLRGGDGCAQLLVMLPAAGTAPAPDEAADREAFSYTVSHDLRAPIRVVEGFTRILKEDYGRLLDRIGNDHLDRVLGAAARMNSMIDALLALAQLSTQPIARQPVNLSQLAGFIVDDLRRDAPKRQIDVRVQPGLMAAGDPTLLRLVLENLLGNAFKYTGKCAVAHIAFESTEIDGRQVFLVRDNGAGFDMRFADRLFGVFQRLHSANDFQGTGVGLASVRRIVRRHGGEVWAESEVGRGASFYFTLPSR